MDIRLLEFFLRVAEVGSINKTAAALHISQPALSRLIATLEHEMGVPLFLRSQGGVRLTEAGSLLADRARPLLRQFSVLKEDVGEQAAGHLAVGTPPAWQHVFTSHFVERLVALHPKVRLRIYEGMSNVLREQMFAGSLDIAIVPFDPSPPLGYQQRSMLREPMLLVGSADEGLRVDHPVNLSYLDGRSLVLGARPNVARAQIERAMARRGMNFKLAVETDTLTLSLELAQRGVGFAVVPSSSLPGRAPASGISWAPIIGQSVTWAMCENSARTHSQAVREGAKLVHDRVIEVLRLNIWPGAEAVKLSSPE